VSRRAQTELSEQMVVLNAAMQALVCDNVKMRAELDELKREAPSPQEWIALKAAPRGTYAHECVRSWCESGLIGAKKDGGRWFVNVVSLNARLARLKAA